MGKVVRRMGATLLCAGLLLSVGVVKGSSITNSQEPQKETQKKDKEKDKAKPNPDKETPPDQSNTVTVSGKVATVGDARVTIVDDQKAELTVALTPNTKITKGDKPITLADLKADDMVTILAKKGDDDSLMAVSIVVA